eukprot:TRINITY_DN1188_c0_g1_i12.p1 TRINITY_DN1188_c0_g1~~TRINITY_DN1188_c0_g1_i12.p1  ORF type:complete len:594 (+),score=35.63 TRINITY_DN1188_c0_g1_i12:126-1907(+)
MGNCCFLPQQRTEQITFKVVVFKKSSKQSLEAKIIKNPKNINDPIYDITIFPKTLWTGKNKLWISQIKQEAKKAAIELHTSSQTKRPISEEITELLIYAPKFPELIKFARTSQLSNVDFFYLTSSFLGNPIVDRTSTLNGQVRTRVLDPVPPFDPAFTKTLSQICHERAREIMNVAMQNNYTIKILWSGGIDSTGLLVAFLECFDLQTLRAKVEILYNASSVLEYPDFYYRYSKQLNFRKWSGYFEEFLGNQSSQNPSYGKIESQDILVTGEHGDQLFGSDKMRWAFTSQYVSEYKVNYLYDALDRYWQEIIPMVLEETDSIPKGSGSAWVQWIFPQVVKSPIPILTVFDFLWWINFSMKWQNVTMRMLMRCSLDPQSLESLYNRMYHFYRTEDFQQWSYHNHSQKFPSRVAWVMYKLPLKQYIYNYTKDQVYYVNKQKEISLRLLYSTTNVYGPNIALSANFEHISWGDHSICVELMKHKYGPHPFENLLLAPQSQQDYRTAEFSKVDDKQQTQDRYTYGEVDQRNIGQTGGNQRGVESGGYGYGQSTPDWALPIAAGLAAQPPASLEQPNFGDFSQSYWESHDTNYYGAAE